MNSWSSSLRSITRIISGDKVIESKLLNLLGVQIARTLAARSIYCSRRTAVRPDMKNEFDQLSNEGILIWPNFLSNEQFEPLREEVISFFKQGNESVKRRCHGPNNMTMAHVINFSKSVLPNTYRFLSDIRLQAILRAGERRPLHNLLQYADMEVLTQGQSDRQEDPQTQLHSDIWFNTHKAWFYIDDVAMEDGPLVYVKGSHRIHPLRLFYLYKDSCKRTCSADPSRRITQIEAKRLDVRETIVTCAKNTLVIANTCGYHRRLQGQAGRKRYALHLLLRANPFAAHALRSNLARYPQLHNVMRSAKASLFGRSL